jgi:hypothetical protein
MDPECIWRVLPISAQGDIDENIIYTAVGQATTRWERLEYQLSILYGALLNTRNVGAANGYGTISAFSGRQSLLQAAMTGFRFIRLPGFHNMKKCLNEAGKFSSRRNEIAHGVCGMLSGSHNGWYLRAAEYATNKRSAPHLPFGRYAYTSDQILYYSNNFLRLADEVAFWEKEVRESWRIRYEGWPRPVTKWHEQ